MFPQMHEAIEGLCQIRFLLDNLKNRLEGKPIIKLSKLVWTKDSWKRVGISLEEAESYRNSIPKVFRDREMGTPNPMSAEMKMVQEIENSIQVDSACVAVDDIPQSVRDLFEFSDVWKTQFYQGRQQLSKIVDPITQAIVYEEWGQDSADKDKNERASISCRILEDTGELEETDAFDDLPSGIVLDSIHRVYNIKEDFTSPKESGKAYREMLDSEIKQKLTENVSVAELDNLLTPLLTYSLNSPYCAFGYSPPKRRFESIFQDAVMPATEAADSRETFFIDLVREIEDASSIQEIGVGEFYEQGLYKKIHGMNQYDKGLVNLCKRGLNIKDDDEKGTKEKAARTKIMSYLFLKKTQWNAIYNLLELQRKRVTGKLPKDQRHEAMDRLRKGWKKIETLSDLIAYQKWAKSREFTEDGKIIPSLIDKISIQDESRWNTARVNLENRLREELNLNKALTKQLSSYRPTGAEQGASCLDPHCNHFTCGEVFQTKINGKEYKFIRCEGCESPIFLKKTN